MSMTDRELLELAAKAAGWEGGSNGYVCGSLFSEWNPLTDDGDALRLAVKLWIHPCFYENIIFAGVGGTMTPSVNEHVVNDDPYAATRRAIVRAAAEIGKGMK
jgi:hypothetical protein